MNNHKDCASLRVENDELKVQLRLFKTIAQQAMKQGKVQVMVDESLPRNAPPVMLSVSTVEKRINATIEGWVLPMNDAIRDIQETFAVIHAAVLAGGPAKNLQKVLDGTAGTLLDAFDRLTALVEYPMSPLPPDMKDHVEAMGQEILVMRNALHACLEGNDGGAALRALAQSHPIDLIKHLARDVQQQIDQSHRSADPELNYICGQLDSLIQEGRKFQAARTTLISQLIRKQHSNPHGLDAQDGEALRYLQTYSADTARKAYKRWKDHQAEEIRLSQFKNRT